MSSTIFLLIIGMAVVTYIPRAIPAVLIEKMKFSPRMEKFLRLIPYTAMAALIFPGLLTVDSEHLSIGIVGALVAAVSAWSKMPVMVTVISAILVNLLMYILM